MRYRACGFPGVKIFDSLLERFAVDELHDVIRLAVRAGADFMNRHDAGVFELPGDLSFQHKARLLVIVSRPHPLERHVSADAVVRRKPNLTHAALGVKLLQYKSADRSPGISLFESGTSLIRLDGRRDPPIAEI